MGRSAQTISLGGTKHSFVLAVSSGRAHTSPRPLVLVFHGWNSSGARFADQTRVAEVGAAQGFVVAVPDGPGGTWQFTGNGNDADYIDALVDHIEARTCIDVHREFTVGFSAGAAFAIAYTCKREDRIAALATVAVDFQLGCTQPIPYLAFHGTADPAVPYENGAVGISLPGVKVRGTELNLGDWARLDGCDPTPKAASVGSEVTHRTWRGCRGSSAVELYSVLGGGHNWPGSKPVPEGGLTTQQVDATSLTLSFFSRHHLP